MTAQGVMSSPTPKLSSMLTGLSTPDVSAKGTNGASFEEFMTTSKESKVQDVTPKDTGREAKEMKESSADIRDRAKDFFTGESKVKEAESTPKTETSDVSEETVEAVSSLLVQVQQVICTELGISEEELTAAMEALGLKTEDLLDRSNLQELFLQLENVSEPTELLTDEELFGSFADLMQAVEQTLQDAGMTSEAVKNVLSELELTEKMQEAEETVAPEASEVAEELLQTKTTEGTDEVTEGQSEDAGWSEQTIVSNEVQTKTESDGSDSKEKHTVSAREEGNNKVISSETDGSVRDMFIDTLTNVAMAGVGEEAVEAAAQLRDIANQIMEQIKIVIKPDQTNMELQLNPEHLGRVNLTITEKEGMMTAQFTTQSEVAKEAIESQMAALKETLQSQGIKVESIEVTVSEFGFERDRDAKQSEEGGSGKQKRRNVFGVEEAEESAPQMSEYLNVTDSSVDYSA